MAEKSLIKVQEFENTDTIQIDLDEGASYPGEVRVVVDKVARPDLVQSVRPRREDPEKSLIVKLKSPETGRIQVLGKEFIRIGQANAEEAASSMAFGMNKAFASRADQVRVTSATEWETVLELEVEISETDNYRIGVCYDWQTSSSGANKFFHAQLTVDDGTTETVIRTHRERAKQKDSDTLASFFGWPELAPGTHTIRLKLKRDGNRVEARMSNAELEFWR